MADEKKFTDGSPDLEAQLAVMAAKLEAMEAATNAAPAETVSKKPKTITLSGESFKVGGASYKVKFPFISLDGKPYSEADVLESPELQKKLVEGGFNVIEKV